MDDRVDGRTWSDAEMAEMLTGMRAASNDFYKAVQRVGCHPFIEMTGFE